MKKLVFVFLLTFFISFLFQGKRGLWEPDEGRYAECAREMIITGDYVIPRLNLQPHLSKPPITYWAIASSIKLFGKNEFAVRFPNSVAFFLTVLLIFFIAKRIFDFEKGVIAAAVYSTSIFPFIGLNITTTDTILTFFIWLYLFFYFTKRYFLMAFFMGVAFLTKGPPSVLPFLGIVFYNILKREEIPWSTVFRCFAIFLCVGLSWFLVVALKDSSAVGYFLNYEVIGRIKGIHHRNSGPWDWVMYVPIAIFGLSPWVFFVKKRDISFSDEKVKVFVFIFLVPFIVFCFVKSRLPLYILPLMPAVSILISSWLDIEDRKFYKIALASFVCLMAFRIGAVWFPYSKNTGQIFKEVSEKVNGDFDMAIVSSKGWHGLSFYFDKIPEYLSFSDKRKLIRFSSKTVKEKLKEIKEKRRKTLIFVSGKRKALYFENAIGDLKYRKIVVKKFFIYEFM